MKNILFTFLTISFLISCSKKDDIPLQPQEDQLPEATTSGANTAGCIINGKVLIPKNGSQAIGGSPSYGLTIGAGLNFNAPIIGDDYLQIEIANKKDTDGSGIILWLKNTTTGIGNYPVNQSNGEQYSYGPNNNQIFAGIRENDTNKTYWSGTNSGIVKITQFDYLNGVYSGVFSCTLYNKDNSSETIQVTDGRFDIKVATLNK